MKHFLPSSVMLTPFLVKYYDEEPEDTSDVLDTDESQQPQIEANDDSRKPSTQTELEPTLSE
ncbi:hypothetical protein BCU30_021645 [Vibrio lentus]|uniref:Uncharacterized protein n=1 Tax=Vibrio lentus TaxID=136468 RepID=A0AA45A7H4_9VIBR|nr:hypothetical protein [Vibrio lentus]MCB5361274.1 hypothetical protein [Vibrio lentus]MCB5451473.1 hypothetical protein [Vibrio lentus]MCB5463009.1 hypothetical protein [Vibrio lentus]MCC4793893.1 hypothetical protein [Vibrio lentus]MCC4849413.1 hypothetical protein [Vibrio lentus]